MPKFLELHVVRCVTLAQREAGVQVGLEELGLLHRRHDLFPRTDLSFMSVQHEHAREPHHPTTHAQTYTHTRTKHTTQRPSGRKIYKLPESLEVLLFRLLRYVPLKQARA